MVSVTAVSTDRGCCSYKVKMYFIWRGERIERSQRQQKQTQSQAEKLKRSSEFWRLVSALNCVVAAVVSGKISSQGCWVHPHTHSHPTPHHLTISHWTQAHQNDFAHFWLHVFAIYSDVRFWSSRNLRGKGGVWWVESLVGGVVVRPFFYDLSVWTLSSKYVFTTCLYTVYSVLCAYVCVRAGKSFIIILNLQTVVFSVSHL